MENNSDIGFPTLDYQLGSDYQNGFNHGQQFSEQIKELVTIRTKLLLKRSPHLATKLEEYAQLQFLETKKFSPSIAKELEGISQGSGVGMNDIIILNNYTDFRDIQLAEEGCTTVSLINDEDSVSGQTWDMHSSAKNYLMNINIKDENGKTDHIIYTVCGCVALAGVNKHNQFIGVNNINVIDGQNGIIWPALIRKSLTLDNLNSISKLLIDCNITSGHNYLLSDGRQSQNIEVTPTRQAILKQDEQILFHTNHCLDPSVIEVEDQNNISATTYARHKIVENNIDSITNENELEELLKSHEGFPLSICSHYTVNNAKDPSHTCGGMIYNFNTRLLKTWRGCQEYDDNFKEVVFKL